MCANACNLCYMCTTTLYIPVHTSQYSYYLCAPLLLHNKMYAWYIYTYMYMYMHIHICRCMKGSTLLHVAASTGCLNAVKVCSPHTLVCVYIHVHPQPFLGHVLHNKLPHTKLSVVHCTSQ